MNFTKFLFSRYFLINIIIAFLAVLLILKLTMRSIRSYTHHGESITVPDLRGLTIDQVRERLKTLTLTDTIIDSVYVVDQNPEVVLDQNPQPEAKVKEGRKIYLTINSRMPPKVKMPNLVDKSLRQAQLELETYGLKIGKMEYRPDLALNAVLEQQYHGKPVKSGELIPKGSSIDLILGNGLGETKVDVPNLIGLTLEEAKWALISSNLNIGSVVIGADVTDTASAVIYMQNPDFIPESSQQLNFGEAVDIYLSQTLPEFLNEYSADPDSDE